MFASFVVILLPDNPLLPDTKFEIAFIVIAFGSALLLAGLYTPVDAWAVFFVEDTEAFLFSSDIESELAFEQEDIVFANRHAQFSLGSGAFAAERLFCFEEVTGKVTKFRSADIVEGSTLTSVSGGCTGDVNGFIHTHPNGERDLSQEDRDVESSELEWTCIMYREISVSPISGEVGGLDCYQVPEAGSNAQFSSVPVTVLNN